MIPRKGGGESGRGEGGDSEHRQGRQDMIV